MRNFEEITIKQVQEGYLSGEFSCEELVKWYLERIEKFNFQGPELRAMITVNPNALEEARRMDEYVKEHHALMGGNAWSSDHSERQLRHEGYGNNGRIDCAERLEAS